MMATPRGSDVETDDRHGKEKPPAGACVLPREKESWSNHIAHKNKKQH
jgi:hypothetical protein